jgi:hypothetical protein
MLTSSPVSGDESPEHSLPGAIEELRTNHRAFIKPCRFSDFHCRQLSDFREPVRSQRTRQESARRKRQQRLDRFVLSKPSQSWAPGRTSRGNSRA